MSIVRPDQALALQAALLPGADALRAFSQWCATVSFDDIDASTSRLVPRMYSNVHAAGADAPIMGRMRGIYRYTWVNNRLKLATAEKLVGLLNERGIASALLKGAAILARWTDDAGLRPMDDVDILVRRDQAHAAAACLMAAGYRSTTTQLDRLIHREFDEIHAVQLRSPDGHYVDLHWRALQEGRAADQDPAFWDRAQAVRLADASTHVLSAEDQLYHTCAHAASSSNGSRIDWVIDAAVVLRKAGDHFDWDRFVAHSRRDRIEIPVRAYVALLRDIAQIPIAHSVDRQLRSQRPDVLAQLDFTLRRRGNDNLAAGFKTFLAFQDFRRRSERLCRRPAPAAVLPFLASHWRLEKPSSALMYAPYVALGRPPLLRPMLGSGQRRSLLAKNDLSGGLLDFTAADLTCDPFVFGWSPPEAQGRWTDGPEAVLGLRIEQSHPRVLPISLRLLPFVPGRKLNVEVWAGSRQVEFWSFAPDQQHWQARSFFIDCATDRPAEPIEIALVMRTPQSPADLGLSRDQRRLGLLVRNARVGYSLRPDAFDRSLDFRAGSEDSELLWSGWSPSEPTGSWTNGKRAVLGLRLPGSPDRDISVSLAGFIAMGPAKHSTKPIAISANGRHIADLGPELSDGIRLTIPRDAIDQDGSLAITFKIPQPLVPSVHGLSTDTRALGLHLSRVTLSQ